MMAEMKMTMALGLGILNFSTWNCESEATMGQANAWLLVCRDLLRLLEGKLKVKPSSLAQY